MHINNQHANYDRQTCLSLQRKIYDMSETHAEVQSALRLCEKAFDDYERNELCVAFNGGKDCTVVLAFVFAVFVRRYLQDEAVDNNVDDRTCVTSPAGNVTRVSGHVTLPTDHVTTTANYVTAGVDHVTTPICHVSEPHGEDALAASHRTPLRTVATHGATAIDPGAHRPTVSRPRLRVLRIATGATEFADVTRFVDDCVRRYDLEEIRVVDTSIRAAMHKLKRERPELRAICMGVRRVDPYTEHLTHLCPTDSGYPDYMRIMPILDWSHTQVWEFITAIDIPYCCLYDAGYTSLGCTDTTAPNPDLSYVGEDGRTLFLPAKELRDDSRERLGRR